MTDLSPRFALPLLVAGQAQKEEWHNEAIVRLEALVQPVVETIGDAAPPAAAMPGQSWIVGPGAGGDWAGQAGALATWTEGGWRFAAAVDGMAAFVRASGMTARFAGGAWVLGLPNVAGVSVGGQRVVGTRQPAVAAPVGGAVIDAEGRVAISAILAALRAHGLIAT